jgi:hypothetical protein
MSITTKKILFSTTKKGIDAIFNFIKTYWYRTDTENFRIENNKLYLFGEDTNIVITQKNNRTQFYRIIQENINK